MPAEVVRSTPGVQPFVNETQGAATRASQSEGGISCMPHEQFLPSQLSEFGNMLGLSISGITQEVREMASTRLSELRKEFPGIEAAHSKWSQKMEDIAEGIYGSSKESE